MREYDSNNKDIYLNFETEERSFRSRLQGLRLQAELAKMDVRDGIKKELDDLDDRIVEWKASMLKAKESSSDGWGETKKRLSASWEEIKAGFSKAHDALKDHEEEA